ncbi:MAG: hypothetical protein AB1896_20700, partial [Thermodesulfobacteriota bacterium]
MVRLFPGLALDVRTLTLAPPLSRRLARWPMAVAAGLEWLAPPLRTHALYFLRRRVPGPGPRPAG